MPIRSPGRATPTRRALDDRLLQESELLVALDASEPDTVARVPRFPRAPAYLPGLAVVLLDVSRPEASAHEHGKAVAQMAAREARRRAMCLDAISVVVTAAHPAAGISEVAEPHDASVVVLGSRGQTGSYRLAHGITVDSPARGRRAPGVLPHRLPVP